jgi:hypothetical protein
MTYRVDAQGFLVNETGSRVGFKQVDGGDAFFIRFDPVTDTAVRPDGGPLNSQAAVAFSTLSGDPTDNPNMATALAAKADLVDGVIPGNQLPAGVGVNRVTARLVALGNLTIATQLNSGDLIDDVSLANGDLVLVPNQTNKAENGVYVVGAVPARSTAYDTFAEHAGLDVVVSHGATKAGSVWRFTSGTTGTLGADDLIVSQIDMTGAALTANNLSDLPDASAARTNLALGNVNNTADADKPVSTAQQAAIDALGAARMKVGEGAPAGADLTGTYFRRDFGVLYHDGVLVPTTYTWATRPTANSTNAGRIITVTDIGGPWGSDWICVTYDSGLSYVWVPVAGFVSLVRRTFSSAATVGDGTQQNAGTDTIPAGLIVPGCIIDARDGYNYSGTASNKFPRVLINGTSIRALGTSAAGSLHSSMQARLYVSNATRNAQRHLPLTDSTTGFSSDATPFAAMVDTTINLTDAATVTWTVLATAPDQWQPVYHEFDIHYPTEL